MEQNLYLREKMGEMRPHVLETLVQMQGAQTAPPKEQVRGSFPLNPCFFFIHTDTHTHTQTHVCDVTFGLRPDRSMLTVIIRLFWRLWEAPAPTTLIVRSDARTRLGINLLA